MPFFRNGAGNSNSSHDLLPEKVVHMERENDRIKQRGGRNEKAKVYR